MGKTNWEPPIEANNWFSGLMKFQEQVFTNRYEPAESD